MSSVIKRIETNKIIRSCKRNVRVVKELIKLRFQNLMMFRLGFFGPFFVDGSLFFVQLIVFRAIYSNIERIGTWEKGEMIVFIGTFSMINAFNMIIYFFGVNSISGKIRNGELDLYLTKPVSPLVRLTFEHVNPGSIPLLFMSIVIVLYGIGVGELQISMKNVLAYCFFVILMTVLFYELEVIIRSITFFVVSSANVTRMEDAGLELCMQLPGIVFHGIYKLIFYCILPYGIIATIPVQSLIGELSTKMAVYGIVVVLVFTCITRIVWTQGIKRYNSASS